MSDDLIAGAKWTLENAAGMTLENEEVRQLCDMADRIDELEAQLAKAIEALRITDRWLRELDMYASPDYHLVPSLQKVRDTLKELTGGEDGNSTERR